MDISEFNQEEEKQKTPLSDFSLGVEEPKPLVNKATASNLAAHGAALAGPARMKETFDTVNEELDYGNSDTLDKLIEEFDQRDLEHREQTLRSILTDPTLDAETKAEAAQKYKEFENGSLATRIGKEALAADSDPEETYADELVRIDTSAILDEVDIYNGTVQQEMNNIDKASPSRVDQNIEDFVLTFLPFYEGFKFTELAEQIDNATGEQRAASVFEAFVALGHEKEKMREVLGRMPISQRTKIAQFVLDYAKQDLNIHSMRGNKMLMMRNLEEMLGVGSYSDTDKWIDTVASLADVVLPVAPKAIKGVAKGAQALGRKGSTMARKRRYDAAVRRLEDDQTLTQATEKAAAAKEALKNAKTPEEKAAIIKSTSDAIADEIMKKAPKRLDIDMAGSVRQAVALTAKEIETLEAGAFAGKVAETFKRVEAPNVTSPSITSGFRLDTIVDYIRSKVSPVSVSQVYKNTNPAKFRQLDELIVKDETGEAAQLLTGSTRTDHIADTRLPQVGKESGNVAHKVDVYDGHAAGKDMIADIKKSSGRLELTAREKRDLRYEVEGNFRGVAGVNVNTAMSTIRHTDQGVKMSMAYTPKNGGYRSATQAKDEVVKALRKYGVDHKDVVIKARTAEGYVEVSKAQRGIKDYIATVDFDYNFASTDLKNFDKIETPSNWRLFDVNLPFVGKLGLVPQSAIIDNLMFKSAVVASDKAAYIQRGVLQYAKDYAKTFSGLDARQKTLVTEYIVEANEKGLKLDPTSLEVKGFSKKSIEALRQWRQVNDIIYHLDNWDLNKTLRGKGYQKIVSKKGDTNLIAKPLEKYQVGRGAKVYDPEADTVRQIDQSELDNLYDNGSGVFKTRGQVDVGGEMVDHVLVGQTSVYSRAIKDTDETLSYRDGYYHVDYNDPIFITQKFVDSSGQTYDKAVATASNRQDALEYVAKLAADQGKDPETDFLLRFDKRDSTEFEDLEWSMTVNMGRTTQRVRGERLASSRASSDVSMKHSHIESPEESLLKSVQSISNRTAYRDWIDTAKQRFLAQFGHLLDRKGMWPEDVSMIKAEDIRADAKEIANAKSTWEYINSIENGYTDLLHDGSKYLFKAASDIAGRQGFGWLETTLKKGQDIDVNKYGRRKAFRILLASNPFQFITQSSQALPIIGALNPTFLPRVAPQMAFIKSIEAGVDPASVVKGFAGKLAGLSEKEAKMMAKAYHESGISENVSAHSFMREHLHTLVDRSATAKVGGVLDKPIDMLQKIGFEAGEHFLMTSVWLSEYNLLRKAGKEMTPEVLDNLNAKVRALTGDMNRAGEMAYNQNTFSAIAQFWSTPHKIFAQLFMGHKGLTKKERAKLTAGYLLTYGTGADYLTDYAFNLYKDIMGEEMPEEARVAVETGLFQFALNGALTSLSGEEVDVAFSERFRIGIAQPNFVRFVEDLLELNVPTMISNSASGSLVFGHSPKFTTFVNETMRMFTVPTHETKEQAFTAAKSFLMMFPTASNTLKAHYILKWAEENEGKGRSIGRTGNENDDDVNTIEALMKIAGFSTMDELMKYRLSEKLYREGSQPYDDVKQLIKEVNVRMSMEGVGKGDVESVIAILAEVQRVYGDHPVYNKIMMNELKKQAEDSDNSIIRKLMTIAQVSDEHGLENLLRSSDLDDKTKEFLRELQKGISE